MKELEEFPKVTRPGRKPQYPWDTILNGKVWSLEQGEDFKGKADSFRQSVSMAARARGGKAKTVIKEAGRIVVVQFIKD